MSIDKSFILTEKEREDIRREAFEEAAELVLRHGQGVVPGCLVPLSKAILDLGEPEPDPRTRRIEVRASDKWTYVFDRDLMSPVQRFRTYASSGVMIPEHADLLLHALEQERTILFSARRASYSACSCWPHLWSERDEARLEHLNLFLGEE
jgi:hypothetical protein